MIDHNNSRRFEGNNSTSNGSAIRLVLILANSMDCDCLTALFAQRRQIEILEASADLDFSLARCRRLVPHVLVVDPNVAFDATQRTCEAVGQGCARHAILLDDRLREGRLAAVLPLSSVSYLTRHAGFETLLAAVIRGATQGERTFDPEFADRVRRTPRGWRLEQAHNRPSVAALTSRELEVMGLLARGQSVRDCAKQMMLAESTIDNHKSRLMKKLQIHKAAELTHVAIRDGVITV